MRSTIRVLIVAALLCGCREPILHDLTEVEANRVVTQLDAAAVSAEKVKQPDGRWSISVPRKQMLDALRHLDEIRAVRAPRPSLSDQSSMITSREDRKFKLESALAREIEATLAAVEGVLEARVHLNMPPSDPLFGQPLAGAKGSASVLLVTRGQTSLSAEQVTALVSGASGVTPEAVSVLFSANGTAADAIAAEEVLPGAATAAVATASSWRPTRLQLSIALLLCGVLALVILLLTRGRSARTPSILGGYDEH